MSDERAEELVKGLGNQTSYRVLARKYRPSTFDDLIGQEPMVRTLTNAFKLDRIAQAYMLTGVRGVGKTTTARILARALNFETDEIHTPTVNMPTFGAHCEAIIESNHIDVIEMDAASHTGINDIREIIDAVKYKPAAARYKVYIIDEVHMLSTAAFNGLLKTLEEPPEHVKFIFATTEIRKVPVTVLSRCQRFDLRRIEGETMIAFLKDVCGKENVEVSDEALLLVTRASEGSVRDALSLLDQAIAHGGGAVTSRQMHDMLGLADRARIMDLFEHVMAGRTKEALDEVKDQFDAGADPLIILSDLAEFTHLVTTAKIADGIPGGQALSELERTRAEAFAAALSVRILSRAWQMLLKGIEDVQSAKKPLAAVDMVLVRLAYVADLPTPGEALKMLRDEQPSSPSPAQNTTGNVGAGSSASSSQATAVLSSARPIENTDVVSKPVEASHPRPVLATSNPNPQSTSATDARKEGVSDVGTLRINRFEDLIALAEEKRDLPLRSALENQVCLIAFDNGRLEFAPTPQAPRTLASDIKKRLQEWTGADWSVVVAREGGVAPVREQRREEERQRTKDAEEDPVVAAVLEEFPGSKIVNVSFQNDEIDDVLETAPDDGNDDD